MFRGQHILIAKSAEQGGLDFCRDVKSFGGEPLGPVATIGEALDLLNGMPVDGAILDEYLRNGTVAPLVLRLRERRIPFVLLKTSRLTLDLETGFQQDKVLWAWTSAFHVIRELEAEMESRNRIAAKEEPDLLETGPRHLKR